MENLRLPIALVAAMAIQLAAGVWWVSQQALIISELEETVSQLGSRMAIEDNINLKRDVQDNTIALKNLYAEVEELWDDMDGMHMHMTRILELQQRVALLENTLRYTTKPSASN